MKLNQQQRGFTIMEVVITIVLLGILAAGTFAMLSSGFNAYFTSRDANAANNQALLALERITRDLRAIPAANLTTTNAGTLAFTNASGTTITYTRSGTTLTRQAGGGSAIVLSDSLENGSNGLVFTYFTRTGTTTTTPANVYYVTISVNIRQTTSYDNSTYDETLSTTVFPRNFP